MKLFNRQIHLRDFIPPILVEPLNKIRYAIFSSTIKDVTSGVKSFVRPYTSPALGSYSQFNEDLLIDLFLSLKDTGFYIDVGANDPIFNSNTKRFYDKGWNGINIEPGIKQFEKFASSRLRDINLNTGVASIKGELIFYRVEGDSTLSSFNKTVATKMAETYGLNVVEVSMSVLRLVDIFENYVKSRQVDFMSVDAEGFDLDVLKSNDWNKYRPSLVIAEVDSQYKGIIDYMTSCKYLLIFNNNHNAIFLDEDTVDHNLKAIVNNHYART